MVPAAMHPHAGCKSTLVHGLKAPIGYRGQPPQGLPCSLCSACAHAAASVMCTNQQTHSRMVTRPRCLSTRAAPHGSAGWGILVISWWFVLQSPWPRLTAALLEKQSRSVHHHPAVQKAVPAEAGDRARNKLAPLSPHSTGHVHPRNYFHTGPIPIEKGR